MPMGDHLTHPDVPSPRSLNLSALHLHSSRSPPLNERVFSVFRCRAAFPLISLRKQAICAKLELQAVGFPNCPAVERTANWELVSFHVIRDWLALGW